EALSARCREAAGAARTVGLVTAARQSHEIFHAGDEARLAIVAGSAEELATRLGQAGERVAVDGARAIALPGVHVAVGAAAPGRIALLFPGQGSQYLGMGGDVATELACARAVWDAAAELRF